MPMAAGPCPAPCAAAAAAQKRSSGLAPRWELPVPLGCSELLGELCLLTLCPQPPCRLENRWASADGCDPELQPGGPGGLLQLAGMR